MALRISKLSSFQSTRPHGARHRVVHVGRGLLGFNPRARTGRDRGRHNERDRHSSVSIHAPARGATRCMRHGQSRIRRFNPRARTGRDHRIHDLTPYCSMFQSTRPHGARPPRRQRQDSGSGFNPRARTGRDGINGPDLDPGLRFNPRARTGRDSPMLCLQTQIGRASCRERVLRLV